MIENPADKVLKESILTNNNVVDLPTETLTKPLIEKKVSEVVPSSISTEKRAEAPLVGASSSVVTNTNTISEVQCGRTEKFYTDQLELVNQVCFDAQPTMKSYSALKEDDPMNNFMSVNFFVPFLLGSLLMIFINVNF